MADNINVTPGTGNVIAADDIGGGVLAQRVKPVFGVDGTGTDVSASNPLPVVQTGAAALPTGAATETTLAAVVAALTALLTELSDKLDAGGAVSVSNFPAAQPVTDNGGSLTVDGPVTNAELRASAVPVSSAGTVAHDGADSGNPVKMGGYATSAERAGVASGDRVDFVADLTGRQIVAPYANPENLIAGKTADITGTSDTAVIAAQGAGVRIYVTHLVVTNSHATVGTWVNVKDGSTTIYTGYAAAVGGGFALALLVPLRLTANTALNVACETTGANVRASASGYKGA